MSGPCHETSASRIQRLSTLQQLGDIHRVLSLASFRLFKTAAAERREIANPLIVDLNWLGAVVR